MGRDLWEDLLTSDFRVNFTQLVEWKLETSASIQFDIDTLDTENFWYYYSNFDTETSDFELLLLVLRTSGTEILILIL